MGKRFSIRVGQPLMSIAVDEYTDRTDTTQLCIYVCLCNGKVFKEELLRLLPLEGC